VGEDKITDMTSQLCVQFTDLWRSNNGYKGE